MKTVVIIGGGAAGMLASIAAARQNHQVHVFEKNEKLGKKLYITGKGRCNVTNDSDVENLLNHVVSNPKFLYSAFYGFTSQDMMKLIEEAGVPLKTERGQRVFPVSDKSSDIIGALTRLMKKYGVNIHLHNEVKDIETNEGRITGIVYEDEYAKVCKMNADAVIVCTGGVSYKATGSTGDGYTFAQNLGHSIKETMPSLVPLNIKESWCMEMQGLSLKNVRASFHMGKKVLYDELGEMLFTHYGVSGPLILSGSAYIVSHLKKGKDITLKIDLKPALSMEQLDERILRDFENNKNKQFRNSLSALLPAKMIPIIIDQVGIDPYKQVNEVSREERQRLCALLKGLTLSVLSSRDYNEAIITRGGVAVKEVNPSTMESKLVEGLYFAGEVLDLDAFTGGYNLQIAWSTAWLAGNSI